MTTIRRILEQATERFPGAPALRFFRDKAWRTRTYSELAGNVRALADAFHAQGWRYEHPHVALMLENGPEWVETYLAMAGSRFSVIPLDPKFRSPEIAHVLTSSHAFALFTDKSHLPAVEALLPSLPDLRAVVLADAGPGEALPELEGRRCLSYRALLEQAAEPWYDTHAPSPQDVASIIFTSGTTSLPKGAMLTHLNFCSDAMGCFDAFGEPVTRRDSFLIVLPLFHAFAFTTNLVVPMIRGACMAFVQSLRTIGEDIRTIRPSAIMAVPLLAEKMYAKIEGSLRDSRLAKILLACGLGRAVGRRVKKRLGGRLRFLIVGGAPCPVEVLQGYRRLGIPLLEGYGLTECSPVVSIAGVNDSKIGTIGRKLPNIEVRIAEPDGQGVGELQIRGPIVMKGYFRDDAATREAFDGEWLRTGDLASQDDDGYLAIRGRKKALIVNREGKNIYPEEVENAIGRDPLLADNVVVGYTVGGQPGERVGAIIAPDLDAAAAENGGVAPSWEEVEKMAQRRLKEVCRALADYKHPRKAVFLREPLERTSVRKVRRCVYQGKLNEG